MDLIVEYLDRHLDVVPKRAALRDIEGQAAKTGKRVRRQHAPHVAVHVTLVVVA
jgi:hypothetical protein